MTDQLLTKPKDKPVWPEVLSRSTAAVFGGYAVTYCITAFLSVYLLMSPVDNVFIAGMLAFAIYTGAIIYAFGARNHARVWGHFLLIGLLCGGMAFGFGG